MQSLSIQGQSGDQGATGPAGPSGQRVSADVNTLTYNRTPLF